MDGIIMEVQKHVAFESKPLDNHIYLTLIDSCSVSRPRGIY